LIDYRSRVKKLVAHDQSSIILPLIDIDHFWSIIWATSVIYFETHLRRMSYEVHVKPLEAAPQMSFITDRDNLDHSEDDKWSELWIADIDFPFLQFPSAMMNWRHGYNYNNIPFFYPPWLTQNGILKFINHKLRFPIRCQLVTDWRRIKMKIQCSVFLSAMTDSRHGYKYNNIPFFYPSWRTQNGIMKFINHKLRFLIRCHGLKIRIKI